MRLLALALVSVVAACSSKSAESPDARPDSAPPPADAAADAGHSCPTPNAIDTTTATEVTVGNDMPMVGIFDSSVVYPTGASAGAMSYSAVPDTLRAQIRTHIAVSSDHGASWTEAAEANTPEAATIAWTDPECGGSACSGNLITEVTTLVDDVDEPDSTKQWKLFGHRYLVTPGVATHYRLGTISLQTAPAVNGPWTAPAKWIGWNTTGSTYSSTGVDTNVDDLPGMADCLALTEPSAIWLPGALDLAVGCVYLDANQQAAIRIELLRSTDHAVTWSHVATLLHPGDADCSTPGDSINAANLFVSGGNEYVIASPSDDQGYHGCLVFAIDDPATGHVARDANGRAIPVRTIVSSPTMFSGSCTYSDAGGGYQLGVALFADTRVFRIFQTGITSP